MVTRKTARVPTGPDAANRAANREIHNTLLTLQGSVEKLQGKLDRADIALEVAIEDPGVFTRSPMAVKNLDRALRDLTGSCDGIVGHLGMIHHTLKEYAMQPGFAVMARVAKANVEPIRQRTQYSCMAASMMMCLKALGHDTNEDLVNKVMGAQPMKGAAWEQALATAQHFGCRATLTMPSTVEQLKAWTDAGVPVMIAWNPEGRPWSHASVVFDVDADLNVYVADPNIPNPKETVRIVSEADFYKKWYEQFPDYLVRRPACAIEREITMNGMQVRLASQKVGMNLWLDPHKSPLGVPYPKSRWDKLGKASPFRWATPATNIDGTFPEPWRVTDNDAALAFLKKMFPIHKDIYTDHESDRWRGYNRIWVGLRDNRDKQAHLTRLMGMHETLRNEGWSALLDTQRHALWLTDDVPRDVLRGKHATQKVEAKGPQTAPKTQDERRRDDRKIIVEKGTPRDDAARALAERGGRGQGKHKNKQDFDRGHARAPKHRKPIDREASIERLAGQFLEASTVFNLPWKTLGQQAMTSAPAAILMPGAGYHLHVTPSGPAATLIEKLRTSGMYTDAMLMASGPSRLFPGAFEWQWSQQGPLAMTLHLELMKALKKAGYSILMHPKVQKQFGSRFIPAAYSGNPDGKPIYDVKIDHGEYQALSGGHDVMKRLQDKYRIEQGHEPRDPNPRLAVGPEWVMDKAFRGKVNDAFIKRVKSIPAFQGLVGPGPAGGFALVLPDFFDDPNYNGSSEYDVYFKPSKEPGWWEINMGMTKGPGLIQVLTQQLRIKPTRVARWNANNMGPVGKLAYRFLAAQGGGDR